jgi:hypothetical protein
LIDAITFIAGGKLLAQQHGTGFGTVGVKGGQHDNLLHHWEGGRCERRRGSGNW